MATQGDKGRGAKGPLKLHLPPSAWAYRQARGEELALPLWAPPSFSASPSPRGQHRGAASQDPDSSARETTELLWLGMALQGQGVFSGENKFYIKKKILEKHKS